MVGFIMLAGSVVCGVACYFSFASGGWFWNLLGVGWIVMTILFFGAAIISWLERL